jgi:predicted DNA binding CopG/RHH family protein
MTSSKKFDITLDQEEQDLLHSIEQGLWKTDKEIINEAKFAHNAASQYLRKDARVNIRISSNDLAQLKQKAAYKGLPYQTFIASILHEYAAGHFVENR